MAENHYVDSKDQHIAAEGVADHSELTVFYANAKKEELGPWMQEGERQAAMKKDRDALTLTLRKSAVLIGLCASLPVVIGIILGQFFMTHLSIENAMLILFLIIFAVGGFMVLTYVLFKWVGETFHHHNLRALPITLTTLASLVFIIQPLFRVVEHSIGGIVGYSTALLALLFIGIVVATVSIFAWTSPKIHGVFKLLVLLLFFGVSVTIFYLA